jgi:hypothetical protein
VHAALHRKAFEKPRRYNSKIKNKFKSRVVVQVCKTSCLRGRDREDHGSRPTLSQPKWKEKLHRKHVFQSGPGIK